MKLNNITNHCVCSSVGGDDIWTLKAAGKSPFNLLSQGGNKRRDLTTLKIRFSGTVGWVVFYFYWDHSPLQLDTFHMSRAATEDAVDDGIRRTIWNGTVPVMFTLAPAEVTGTATPRPLFVRRLSSHHAT